LQFVVRLLRGVGLGVVEVAEKPEGVALFRSAADLLQVVLQGGELPCRREVATESIPHRLAAEPEAIESGSSLLLGPIDPNERGNDDREGKKADRDVEAAPPLEFRQRLVEALLE
jgi:hypothetical protein